MNELKSWVITLVTISVLCLIIESFAPKGNMGKYVKLVCGLAVTTIIAMPILNFLNSDIEIDSIAWNQYMQISEVELKSKIVKMEEDDSAKILELYRTALINHIKTHFKGHRDFVVTDVDALLYEGYQDDNYASIRCIYITLEPSKENKVGVLSKQSEGYIKNQLTEVLAIKEDQIIIDVSKFNGGK